MRQTRYTRQARLDLLSIQEYIAEASGSVRVAEVFVSSIRDRCRKLAALPTELGRLRPDLRQDLRSVTVGRYIVFLIYRPRVLEVVRIVHGRMDQRGLHFTSSDGDR